MGAPYNDFLFSRQTCGSIEDPYPDDAVYLPTPNPRPRRCISVERNPKGGYSFKLEEISGQDPPYGTNSLPPKS